MQISYDGKNLPKPKKWSKSMNNYEITLKGQHFSGLTFEQYKVLNDLKN